MISMIYHGYEIEALPEWNPQTQQWLAHFKLNERRHEKLFSRQFSLPDAFPTEKQAINHCWDYGREMIDKEIMGLSNDNS